MVLALKRLSEAIQKRISGTSNVLGSMKETKMLGLVEPWTSALMALMDNQIVKSMAHRVLFTLMIVFGMFV